MAIRLEKAGWSNARQRQDKIKVKRYDHQRAV
jgi:hypothetical protein